MNNILLTLVILSSCFLAGAQNLSGPTTVRQGETHQYYYYSDYLISRPAWSVTGGTVVSSGQDSGSGAWANIQFNTTGSSTVTFKSGTATRGTASVNVLPPPPPAPSAPAISANTCGTKTLTRGTPPSGVTWFWHTANLDQSTVNSNVTYDVPSTQTIWLRARDSYGIWSSTSTAADVTVIPQPSPGKVGGSQTICHGATPIALTSVFEPSGADGSFTYQWQQSADGGTWANAPGASTGTTYAPGTLTTTTYYRRAESSICGTIYAITPPTVTVYAAPNPGSISGSQTICYGTTPAPLSNAVSPSGGNGSFTYQWQQSADGSSWSSASGTSTSLSYAPSSLTATTYYRRAAISSCGTTYTSSVTIAVYGNLASGSIGSSQTICYGTTPASLSNTASPSGGNGSFTYQWQQSPDGSSWSNASGTSTGLAYAPPALTATTYYRRTAISSCGTTYTSSVAIGVYSNVANGSIGSNQTICPSTAPATLTNVTLPSGGNGSFTYQWEQSGNGSSWSNALGASTSSTYSPGVLSENTYYRRRESTSCGTVYSNTVLITMKSPPVAGTLSGASEFCDPNTEPQVYLTLSGAANGKIIWFKKPPGGSWEAIFPAPATTSMSEAAIHGTQYQVRVNNGCTEAVTSIVTINVYASSRASAINSSLSKGYNSLSAALNVQSATGSILAWQQRLTDGAWSDVANTAGLSVIDITVNETTHYRVSVKNGTCAVAYSPEKQITIVQHNFEGRLSGTARVTGGTNSGTLTLLNCSGSVLEWQQSDDGLTWTAIASTSGELSFSNLLAPRYFRVKVYKKGTTSYTQAHRVDWYPAITNEVAANNYTKEETLRLPETDSANLNGLTTGQKLTAYSYFDGLGRVVQNVQKSVTPAWQDAVRIAVYDTLGDQRKQYLPFVSNGDNYYSAALTLQGNFYNGSTPGVAGDANPWMISITERSARGTVLEQGAPGTDWQPGSDHTVRYHWRSNGDSEIRLWKADGTSPAYYSAGTVYINEVTDENGNRVMTFSDKLGRLLEKHVEAEAGIWNKTLNIYDEAGHLKYTVQPEGVKQLGAATTLSAALLDQYAFQYTFDERNRLVEKKEPGTAPAFYCYDPLDRLVLMQDGHLRTTNQWMYVKYDRQNRPVMQGIYTNAVYTTRTALQQNVLDPLYATGPWYEEKQGGTAHGYSNYSFPAASAEVLAVNYYDDHDFDAQNGDDYTYAIQALTGEGTQGPSTGMATGSKRLVLGTAQWLVTYVFYDSYGRVIQVRGNNHLSAVADNVATTVYNFDGTVNTTKADHHAGANHTTVVNRYNYDHAGRLVNVYQNNNNAPADQLVAQYRYNALGQLSSKDLHQKGDGSWLQTIDYSYSIRGWLKKINDPGNLADDRFFAMELLYNEDLGGLGQTRAWNGNITATKWKEHFGNGANETQKTYAYTYSKNDQLKQAKYAKGAAFSQEADAFNEQGIAYDANGNIKSMLRNGKNSTGAVTTIDNLNYTYASDNPNHLMQVEDASANATGFSNGATSSAEFSYNENGSISADLNKGITSITYNMLGKPAQVNFSDGGKIDYLYDAAGMKLQMKVTQGSVTVTDYVGNFVYENNNLAFFSSPEGRVTVDNGIYDYQYALTDHQGNTRKVLTAKEETLVFKATFESAVSGLRQDTDQFENTGGANEVSSLAANVTPGGARVVRLNNTYHAGPGMMLRVYPGDKIDASVYAYHENSSGYGTSASLGTMITAIAGAFGGVSGGTGEAGAIYDDFAEAITTTGLGGNRGDAQPSAWLNYIFFDENDGFDLVNQDDNAGFELVPAGAFMNRTLMNLNVPVIKKPGYLYIYLSYENESPNWVYFDDLNVTYQKSPVVQSSNYYAFGGSTQDSWTRLDTKPNQYLYNAGSELNSVTKNYEMFFREYDPWIGRMNGVDPMAAKYASMTPYNYAFNDPVALNDPSGADPWWEFGPNGASRLETTTDRWQRTGDAYMAFRGRSLSVRGSMDLQNSQMHADAAAVRNGQMGLDEYTNLYESVPEGNTLLALQQAGIAYQNSGGQWGYGTSYVTATGYHDVTFGYKFVPFKKGVKQGEIWYYVLKTEDGQHAGVYRPKTHTFYDVNHPNNGETHGLLNRYLGGEKSRGYKFNMNNKREAKNFWNFGGGRGELQLAPVYVPNPQAAVDFFEGQVGESYEYYFFTSNCKHFAIDGFREGGAIILNSGPAPTSWTHSPFSMSWQSGQPYPVFNTLINLPK